MEDKPCAVCNTTKGSPVCYECWKYSKEELEIKIQKLEDLYAKLKDLVSSLQKKNNGFIISGEKLIKELEGNKSDLERFKRRIEEEINPV